MKATQQQLTDLLIKTLALKGVELVEDEAESDFDQDALLQMIDDNRGEIIKSKFEADYKSQADKAANGKSIGAMKAALKRWSGAPESAFTKEMNFDQMMETALAHYTSTLDNDKGEAQKQLDEILKKHQEDLAAIQSQYETEKNELTGKLTKRDILAALSGELKDAPLRKGYDRNIAVEDAYNHMQTIYDVKWNSEKNTYDLIDRKTGLSAMNEAKTLPLKGIDVMRPYFEQRGAWEKDTRNEDAVTPTNQNGQPYQRGNTNQPLQGKPSSPEEQRQARLAQYEAQE